MQLPSDAEILGLVGAYGRLRAGVRSELGRPTLVLPTGHFFPDAYDASPGAALRLVQRLQLHASMADIPVRVAVVDENAASGGCSSSSCSTPNPGPAPSEQRLSLDGDGWVLRLTAAELAHPVALTTTMARALGAIFLEETRPETISVPQPTAPHQDLTAVALGLGVLLLEGAYVYSKSCGGPRVSQLTALSAPELAVAVAVYSAVEGVSLKQAIRCSSTTQKALLKDAAALLRGNPQLPQWVKTARVDDPSPTMALGPAKAGWLSDWFAPKSRAAQDDDIQALLDGDLGQAQWAQARSARSAADERTSKRRHLDKPDDELKALVAEALER